MAVQIPRVKVLDPSVGAPPAESGYVNPQQPNVTAGMEGTRRALDTIGSEQENFINRLKENAAETKTQAIANDYEDFRKTQVGESKKIQGDPTDHYTDIDNAADDHKDAIFKQYDDLDNRSKQLLTQKLMGVDRRINDQLSLQEGIQYQTYQRGVRDTAVENAQDYAASLAPHIATGDPNAMKQFDTAVDNIRQTFVPQARAEGLISSEDGVGPDGQPIKIDKYDPILLRQQRIAVGKAVYSTVQTLNNSGQPEAAKQLIDKYSDEFTSMQLEQLSRDHSAAQNSTEASAIVDKLRNLDPEAQIDAINKMDVKPEVRQKAISLAHTQIAAADAAKSAAQKRITQNAYQYINSGKQFVSKDQVTSDPYLKPILARVDEKQRQGIIEAAINPKDTDPKAIVGLNEAVRDGSLSGMSPEDLQTLKVGMNAGDRSKADTLWRQANDPNSSKQWSNIRNAQKQALDMMQAAGQIKKTPMGKWDQKSELKIAQMHQDMSDAVNDLGPGASVKDVIDAAKNYTSGAVKQNAFTSAAPQAPVKLQSSPTAPPAKKASGPPPAQDPDFLKNLETAKVNFQNANGRAFSSQLDKPAALQKYWPKPGDK